MCPPGVGDDIKCQCGKPKKTIIIVPKEKVPGGTKDVGTNTDSTGKPTETKDAGTSTDSPSDPAIGNGGGDTFIGFPTGGTGGAVENYYGSPETEVGNWSEYITDAFIEPDVHMSHAKYAEEALDRLRNPSRFTAIDDNTDGISTHFDGLARPRQVAYTEGASLVPDIPEGNFRAPINDNSAQGLNMAHYGYT